MLNLKKIIRVAIPTIAGLFLFAGMASAHVTVKPDVSAPGAWETYTIKVPVEKEDATNKVTLKIPNGVEFEQYQPAPDWKVTTKKNKSGKVTMITWEATGDGILPGQFQQFNFVAKNPDKAGTAAWDAYQYYKDGTIVEWTGNENSQSPHSITNITSSKENAAQQDTHDHTGAKEDNTDKAKSNNIKSYSSTLSIVALVIAILALVTANRKKK